MTDTPSATVSADNHTVQARASMLFNINQLSKDIATQINQSDSQDNGQSSNVTFSKQTICVARDLAISFNQLLARDLEEFAKHARRSVITIDDCLLFTRRNPGLTNQLMQFMQDNSIKYRAAAGNVLVGRKSPSEQPSKQPDEPAEEVVPVAKTIKPKKSAAKKRTRDERTDDTNDSGKITSAFKPKSAKRSVISPTFASREYVDAEPDEYGHAVDSEESISLMTSRPSVSKRPTKRPVKSVY